MIERAIAKHEEFFKGMAELSFLPGHYYEFDIEDDQFPFDQFCVHFCAKEAVIAEFEVYLDGVLQDYFLNVTIPKPFMHAVAIGKCKSPKILKIFRKDESVNIPVFVIEIDGLPSKISGTGHDAE